MNEMRQVGAHTSAGGTSQKRSGFGDLVLALARKSRLLVGLPLVFAIIAAGLSLSMQDTYRASTRILPKQEAQSNVVAMLGQLGSLSGSSGTLSLQIPIDPNSKITLDLYISLLKSRSIADNLVQRFKLDKVYQESGRERVRETLARNTRITAGKDGLIVIAVDDTDPQRATQLVNAYVEELFELAKSIQLTESSKRRQYFERQLQSAKKKMAALEASFKGKSPAANSEVGSQGKGEQIANLQAEIAAREIQLEAIRTFASGDQQDYHRLQQEIFNLRADLSKLGAGEAKSINDLHYYAQLSSLLETQLENARFQEANDFSILEVVDPADAPEKPYKPDRKFIVLSAALLGLLAAVCWVLILEVVVRPAVLSERWREFRGMLFSR